MLGAMIDSELMAMASIHYDVDADRPEEWEEEEEEEEEEVGSTSVPKQHLAVDSPARITQSKRTSTAVGEDAEDEGNILTIKKSRTYTKNMTDDELFQYFDELLETKGAASCRNINCSCLNILKDDRVCATVAMYLAGFEKKNKHEHQISPSGS